MIQYVCGFAYVDDNVILIRKKRPDWMAGLLNGVGGKLEDGEAPERAMSREFLEETGILVPVWRLFCTLTVKNPDEVFARVAFFSARLTGLRSISWPPLDENPELASVSGIAIRSDVVDNLRWLVPMGRAANPVIAEAVEPPRPKVVGS